MAALTVDVIIPALDEEEALPKVLAAVPAFVRRIVVADNGSTDGTADAARRGGAEVVFEGERGYGAACLRAIAHLKNDPPDVVVFLDGDFSDDPSELRRVADPIADGADLVIGSRVARGRGLDRQRGALTPVQRFGNAVACTGLYWLYGVRFSDLGPFRAIRWDALIAMNMVDRNWGWTVEMQIKAAKLGLRCDEVAVSYRRRGGGASKVSGTIKGSVMAGTKILWLLARHAA
ncbi:MAG: glycosyltransferase family 2 protein [Myxococcota bacterium]